jgi:hypothetical protein
MVTREQLQQVLWSADTFVEFEQGVNTAIKKLRQALGDSADNPRFIETLPRKGYRFIAPVEGPEIPTATLAVRWRRLCLPLSAGVLVAIAGGWSLWLVNRPSKAPAAGSVPVPLTSYPGFTESPSFSPDGDRVAFAWDGPKQDKSHIYVKLIGKDPPVRLTSDPAEDGSPAWSPDGRWIAFVRTLPEDRGAVFGIPASGEPS